MDDSLKLLHLLCVPALLIDIDLRQLLIRTTEAWLVIYSTHMTDIHGACLLAGNFDTAHCISCRKEVLQSVVRQAVDDGKVCTCPTCGGYVKPDIVFFGVPFSQHRTLLPESPLPAKAALRNLLISDCCIRPVIVATGTLVGSEQSSDFCRPYKIQWVFVQLKHFAIGRQVTATFKLGRLPLAG